jgi:hypothetical protein
MGEACSTIVERGLNVVYCCERQKDEDHSDDKSVGGE